jgi:hypothetical protein
MASTRRPKAVSSRRVRQPSAWNTLKFRLSSLPLFNPMSEFPMTSRRNILIRTVAAVSGDIATGVAVAAACLWLIEAAALGLFLSFMVWLLGALIALALSQYVVHPTVAIVLSSRKLDVGIDALTGLADRITRFARSAPQPA